MNRKQQLLGGFCALCSVFFLSSCGNSDDSAYTGEPHPVWVSVSGVENFQGKSNTRSLETVQTFTGFFGGRSFFTATLLREQVAWGDTPSSTRASGVSSMSEGTYFRVLAYQGGEIRTDRYAGDAIYRIKDGIAVQQEQTLELPVGTYRMVAYSYNSTAALNDSFDGSASAILSDIADGSDFLCADQSLTVSEAGVSLPLLFKRLCSRVQVKISASDKITVCDAVSLVGTLPTSAFWTVGESSLVSQQTSPASWRFPFTNLEETTVVSEGRIVFPKKVGTDLVLQLPHIVMGGNSYNDGVVAFKNVTLDGGANYSISVEIK